MKNINIIHARRQKNRIRLVIIGKKQFSQFKFYGPCWNYFRGDIGVRDPKGSPPGGGPLPLYQLLLLTIDPTGSNRKILELELKFITDDG